MYFPEFNLYKLRKIKFFFWCVVCLLINSTLLFNFREPLGPSLLIELGGKKQWGGNSAALQRNCFREGYYSFFRQCRLISSCAVLKAVLLGTKKASSDFRNSMFQVLLDLSIHPQANILYSIFTEAQFFFIGRNCHVENSMCILVLPLRMRIEMWWFVSSGFLFFRNLLSIYTGNKEYLFQMKKVSCRS